MSLSSTVVKPNKSSALLLPSEASIALPGAGKEWLDTLRSDAANQFAEQGLPTVRDEEWRYTDIRKIKRQQFTVATSVPDVAATLAKLPDYDLPRIVLVNGFYAPACSSTVLPEGVNVSALNMRLQDDSLNGLLGSTLPTESHAFTALNSA